MKILLLGANGQLGNDIQMVHKKLFVDSVKLVTWTRADLDVANIAQLTEKLLQQDFDVLINCTSFHKTEQVEQEAQTAFLINAHAVGEMAKVCEVKKSRFVHISTDYVFGAHSYDRPLLETDVTSPYNVYGASKLMGEGLARLYCERALVLRVASLFGIAGSSVKGGNFVTTMLRLGKERESLNVVCDQIMSPTWTYEIATVIFMLLDKAAPADLYHMVNTGVASWFDFAKEIFTLAEYDVSVNPVKASEFPAKVIRPSYSALNNEKIQRVLNYAIPAWQLALKNWFEAQTTINELAQ